MQRRLTSSAVCEFAPRRFYSCNESPVRRAAPQHLEVMAKVRKGPTVTDAAPYTFRREGRKPALRCISHSLRSASRSGHSDQPDRLLLDFGMSDVCVPSKSKSATCSNKPISDRFKCIGVGCRPSWMHLSKCLSPASKPVADASSHATTICSLISCGNPRSYLKTAHVCGCVLQAALVIKRYCK